MIVGHDVADRVNDVEDWVNQLTREHDGHNIAQQCTSAAQSSGNCLAEFRAKGKHHLEKSKVEGGCGALSPPDGLTSPMTRFILLGEGGHRVVELEFIARLAVSCFAPLPHTATTTFLSHKSPYR